MRTTLENLCNSFIENRDVVKRVFKWDNDLLIAVCGATFMGKESKAEADKLEACKKLLKSETGVLSNFRGNVQLPLIAMLATEENPEEKMKQTLKYYDSLKAKFSGSEYLALAAAIMADMLEEEQVDGIAGKAKDIYDRMKKEHPFLTSSEDSVYAVLMALSGREEETMIKEAELCYSLLKEKFHSSNDVQALAHVLAIADGTAEEKCNKVITLFDALTEAGVKYGKNQELVVLASLALLPEAKEKIVEDMQSVDAFLAEQKGYGILGLDKKTRLLHAAMIVSADYCANNNLTVGAITGTVGAVASQQASVLALQATFALIVAQQAALCAVLMASVAASAAARN